jgi:uncharacterized protein YqhQ
MGGRPYIGGQAVLEGVMMRAPKSFAVVVRRRDGSLQVRERPVAEGPKGMARWPLVRGVATLVESLRLGSEALRFSAEQMEKDLRAEESAEAPAEVRSKDKDAARKSGGGGAGLGVLGALGLAVFSMLTRADGEDSTSAAPPQRGRQAASAPARSRGRAGSWLMLAVAIGFFVMLPQAAAQGIDRLMGWHLPIQSPQLQAITGAFKLAIVVGYMLAIRRIPDIRRVFQYHGAEHKTISTYEAGEALTVENARAKTTMHPRCGTTFLVMVALVSIIVFIGVGQLFPRIDTGNAVLNGVIFFVEKLPFLPVIVAVTFELQRFFARYCTTGPLRALLWPGFLVQKITTAEPDDRQLEVALGSLRVTLFRQELGHAYAEDYDVEFPSYDALLAADRLRVELATAA